MLKIHKNAFIDIIKKNGLKENSFRSKEVIEDDISNFIISLNNTPLKFHFRNPKYSFHEFDCKYVRFSPNFEYSEPMPETDYTHNFEFISRIFSEWLNEHVKLYLNEMFEPDYWRQINEQDNFISGTLINEDEMSPFSEDERRQLRLSINELKLLIISNFSPSDDELNIIEGRLQYLSDSLDRLNRIDWRGLVLTTMVSITIALSLDTEKGKMLSGIFKKVFANVLQLLQTASG